jgi:peptidoglycan-associated lipoprotein
MKNSLVVAVLGLAGLAFVGGGCAKKKVAAAAPAPPAVQPSTPAAPAPPQQAQSRPVASTPTAPTQNQGPRVPDAATRARIETLLARVEDAYFDYDKHTLREDAIKALGADSTELRDIIVQYPDYKLVIEGHADERGSEAYNLALGDARAKAAKDYLAGVGIPADQLSIVSYGKDKPICEEHDEACWQKNRRIHIVAKTVSN